MNLNKEINEVAYASYKDIFARFNKLQREYADMSPQALWSAFERAGGFGNMYTPNPTVQNRRVKGISTLPEEYSKDKVTNFVKYPVENEKELRQVEHQLEHSAYPLFHTRTVYQNLLTYHWYFAPDMLEDADTSKKEFWREYKLIHKLAKEFEIKSFAHEVTGQALQEGKVFYYPRYLVDKAHNNVVHAYLQQLPSDYCKIVGFNNKSKYTIAFDLMYFAKAGTDIRQFGDLFSEYFEDFNNAVYPAPKGVGGRLLYSSNTKIDLKNVRPNENVEAYYQNGKWYYWVVLPVDEVFTFEIDDTSRLAISPLIGMFIDLIQLSQLEAIQLELIQNPLVSVLTGEIPYYPSKDTNNSDQYMMSNASRTLFETFWYSMLNANNTSGIGWYAAPLQNMKLHSLAESPSAMDIVSNGYEDTMSKAGLTALIPVGSDARAGAVNVSLMIESKFPQTIYRCVERMMNTILEKLRLKYDYEFHMFGDLSSDKDMLDNYRNGMTLGILPDTLMYNAIMDRTILDDICISQMVENSGILDLRKPLRTSFNSSDDESTSDTIATVRDVGGRPPSEEITSEGQEQDEDAEGAV